MQTRKKVLARNASRDHANSRTCRQTKKVIAFGEKKVTELITSSARKQKSAGILSRKNRYAQVERRLRSGCDVVQDKNQDISATDGTFLCHKQSEDKVADYVVDTMFSPAFHHHKDICGGIPDKAGAMDLFKSKDQANHHDVEVEESKEVDAYCGPGTLENQQKHVEKRTEVVSACAYDDKVDLTNHFHTLHMESNHANSSCGDEYSALGNLSSEVSAIYLAMQNSKLECIEEQNHNSMSAEGCVELDEGDEFDDFDPYLFIKDLPDLSAVVPRFRPMLLPKQTRSCPSITLVLDLDETLVHSSLEPCEDADFTFPVNFNLKEHTIYVRCRPYLKDFLERVASLFETIIFTASQSIYAEQLLNVLDPKRKLFRHRVYRESCVFVEGNYLKDLSVLGRDLAHVLIIDNSPQAFGFQIDNGIPIESWFDDCNDRELLSLLPFLESLVGVEDVRPLIAKKFNLREKIASAACLSLDFRR
ncbi:CTD small phosphatase-like protein 2 isoform X2 [Phoenix dactylifera]|uniref:CTD small phosphatase-like protein 2 isoform X2 n=1 Tax=Phoenix dactylifera TaxID=42345 RepID=A0A8B7C390_PHODC|nr:CTD small phosphatase-like protein 2 isoform X2 [Phoenix dactylifera]